MAGAAPGTTFGVDLGFASASTWAWLRQPSPAPQPCLAKPRHMSFLSVSRLLFARPETALQARKRFSAALATFLDTALPRHMSFLSVSRLPFARPGTSLQASPETLLPQLWPQFWTQPCLAKPRHMSFLSVFDIAVCQAGNFFAGPQTLLAALAILLDTALLGQAPSHVLSVSRLPFARPGTSLQARKRCSAALATFLSLSGHSLALQRPRHMSFLSDSRLPFARPETPWQARKRFSAALATFLDSALPCAKPRRMSFLRVSRLPFARREIPLQARKRFSKALVTILDTALPCKAPSHVLS